MAALNEELKKFVIQSDSLISSSWVKMTQELNVIEEKVVPRTADAILRIRDESEKLKSPKKSRSAYVIVGIENFKNFATTLIKLQENARYQIIYYLYPNEAHALAIDICYHANDKKTNIVCFDSASLMPQIEFLQEIKTYFSKSESQVNILACQGMVQHDASNCALFSFIVVHIFAKIENLYDEIYRKNRHISVAEVIQNFKKFIKHRKLDAIYDSKLFEAKDIDGIRWVPVDAMPLKILKTEQSFSMMKANLMNAGLSDGHADKYIEKHKVKYNFKDENNYVVEKKFKYARKFLSLVNNNFQFEDKIRDVKVNDDIDWELWRYFFENYSKEIVDYMNNFIDQSAGFFQDTDHEIRWNIVKLKTLGIQVISAVLAKQDEDRIRNLLDFWKVNIGIKSCDGMIDSEEREYYFGSKSHTIIFYNQFVQKRVDLVLEFLKSQCFFKLEKLDPLDFYNKLIEKSDPIIIFNLLKAAFYYKCDEVIAAFSYLFTQKKIDINDDVDEQGNSYFHFAMISEGEEREAIINKLLELGANTEKRNKDGYTAEEFAQSVFSTIVLR